MGQKYTQITIEERCEIARLQAAGSSIRQIAASLDRSSSTIARELKRNTSRQSGYKPSYAQQLSRARRWSGSMLDRNSGLRETVISRLEAGWSPEQVSGRMARESGKISSLTRLFTGLSMLRSPATRITHGAICSRVPSRNEAGVDAKVALRHRSWLIVDHSQSDLRWQMIVKVRDTGRLI